MAIAMRHPHHGLHGAGRWALMLAVGAAVATVALVLLVDTEGGEWNVASEPAAGSVTETDAVETYLAEARAELFPTYEEPYIGTCPTSGDARGLCSALLEDLGDLRIHTVGVYATDWGADLLLERVRSGWQVIDSSPWPELGAADAFGPPWSPQTTIAEWWSTRSEPVYGPDTVHLRSCGEAGEVAAGGTGQTILCSTLVDDQGDVRVYRSGRVGSDAAVYLRLVEADDHTWSVREVREAS